MGVHDRERAECNREIFSGRFEVVSEEKASSPLSAP